MKEILEELSNNTLIEINNWWGLRYPGRSGTIITKDKKIYNYTIYYTEPPFLKDNNIPKESISKGKIITEEEYSKVIKFIEDEIIDKEFKSDFIFDAGYNVSGNYKEHSFNIPNNKGYGEEKGLYDKTKDLLSTIKGVE